METSRRTFIKNMNWALAGIIGMLGFTDCEKTESRIEYGSPYADYTVKGTVVNKTTGKPIEGIRVGYFPEVWSDEYGTSPEYYYGPKKYVITNAKGEYKLSERSYHGYPKHIYGEDIDGEKNGSLQSKQLQIDFKDAVHSGKSKNWYDGEYTVTVNVELTEIEKE